MMEILAIILSLLTLLVVGPMGVYLYYRHRQLDKLTADAHANTKLVAEEIARLKVKGTVEDRLRDIENKVSGLSLRIR